MENHALTIGTMQTACKVLAYPQAVVPLRSRMERAVEGPFPAFLAKAVEHVLEGREGVIRIRNIALNFNHSGEWDETVLAQIIAAKLAAALAGLIDSSSEAVRIWPDHDTYMASFIEHKLGLAYEPDWAFPEFTPLRLLSPEQASAEVMKARPSVIAALAANGRRTGNPQRIVSRLGATATAEIVAAWTRMPGVLAQLPTSSLDESEIVNLVPFNAAANEPDMHRRILMLIADMAIHEKRPNMSALVALSVTAVAVAALMADMGFSSMRRDALSFVIADVAAEVLPLPKHIAAFVKRIAAHASGPALLDRLENVIAGVGRRDAARHPGKMANGKNKAPPIQILRSPYAGFALLLPDIVRLGMHRHLNQNALRDSVLAIADQDMRPWLETDSLLQAIFPRDEAGAEAEYPPVPFAAPNLLAPESRHLVSGREGADGWGDLLLASFASRLPGLRASSRGYLVRQFLAVPGRADIAGDTLLVALDGPALAVVLKMAGLSGDQMPIPFYGNRLLVLKLGGVR